MPKKDSKDTKEVDMRVQEKGIDAHRVSGLTVASSTDKIQDSSTDNEI